MVEPPKCPNCKKPLFEVWETEYSTWVWNSKKGKYEEDIFDAEIVIRCPYCDTDISDFFEDGVCNFSKGEKNG